MGDEWKTDKFIKAVPGIMAIVFTVTCCYGFIREILSPELFIGIVTPIVTFFVAQKGQAEASKQGAEAALAAPTKPANGNGPPSPPPAPPPAPTIVSP